jgi:two-component system, response regulator PdtaR
VKILIIEDEIFPALHLEAVVQEMGCTVVGIAPDTASAMELAQQEPVDLALVDLNLRDGLTGPEVARQIATRYGTKVLFLTANPRQAPLELDGVLGVVSKPFDDHAIAQAIEAARRASP